MNAPRIFFYLVPLTIISNLMMANYKWPKHVVDTFLNIRNIVVFFDCYFMHISLLMFQITSVIRYGVHVYMKLV